MLDQATEQDIIKRIKQGRREAYAELVDAYKGALFNLAYRVSGNAAEAEDAVQEAFVRAYSGLQTFQEKKKFFPWLYAICLNILRDSSRKQARRESGFSDAATFHPAEIPGPGTQVESRELAAWLEKALTALPLKLREAVVLRYVEELSFKDVAQILKISENAAKKRVYHAIEKLQQMRPKDKPGGE